MGANDRYLVATVPTVGKELGIFSPWWVSIVVLLMWAQPLALGQGLPAIGSAAVTMSIVWLVAARTTGRWEHKGRPIPLIVCYAGIVWVTMGMLFALIPFTRLLDWLSVALVLMLGPPLLGTEQNRRAALRTTSWAMWGWITAAGIQAFVSPDLFGLSRTYDDGRVTALHYNANGGALFLLTGVLVMLVLSSHFGTSGGLRIRAAIIAGCGTWAIVATGSRGALAGVGAGLGALLVLKATARIGVGRGYLQVIMLAAVALIAGVVLPSVGKTLLGREFDLNTLGESRGDVWADAWYQIGANFWFGTSELQFGGLDNSHNMLLEFALRYGVPGAFLFVSLLVAFLVRAWKLNLESPASLEGPLALVLTLGILAYGVTHVAFIDNALVWLMVSGFVGRARQEVRKDDARS